MKKALLLLNLLLMAGAIKAGIYTVCSSSDSGPGSFRQAISDANLNLGTDTINFASSLDGIGILIDSGPCIVTDDLIILGNGIENTLLNGNALSGILSCTSSGIEIIIRQISFLNCGETAVFVDADSKLRISHCQFNNNNVTSTGGGVSYESSVDSAWIDRCVFIENSATEGGAINHQGSYMQVSNTTFSLNQGSSSGGACKLSGDITQFINCTFAENSAPIGGAIKDYNLTPGSYFLNCTFSDNSASSEGGAFHTGTDFIFNTKFSMYNCIVYGNSAPEGADIWNGFGFDGSYENNIVGDCYSDAASCPIWFSTADPLLDPSGLQYNGGVGETILLLAGSPAIDNALSTTVAAPLSDQRIRGRCFTPDIGALESNGAAVTASFSISSCTKYTVPSGEETYTTSGTYNDTIVSSAGCDSIMTINLTITPPITASVSVTECATYTVPSGDEVYSCSGVYLDTIPSSSLCDSIITIDLTILVESSGSFSAFDCLSYTVPSGDESYSTSGIYSDTIPNAAGCDSVLTITVSIGENNSAFAVVACDQYTVPSGDETYFTTGVHTDTILNSAGCDSVMLITMTILESTDTSLSIEQCVPYTVPSGDETYSTSGVYTDTIPNAIGCDSLITLNLTINLLDTTITDSSCGSYTVPSGDETYFVSGTYTDTLSTSDGCDSVLTIEAIVKTAYTGFTVTGNTYTALASPASYQWVECPEFTPVPGETSQSFTAPSGGGSYAVIVTEDGCTDTSVCYNSNSIGISVSELERINIYPNPTKGNFNIVLPTELEYVSLKVYNVLGELVQSSQHHHVSVIQDEVLGEAGWYLILLETENGPLSRLHLLLE